MSFNNKHNKVSKQKIVKWIKLIIIIYAIIGIALYAFQDQLLFHPIVVKRDSVYQFNQHYKELFIPIDIETNINIIQFPVADSVCKGVVLYFHGNRTNISRYEPFAKNFTRNNYSVWMIDYPGFGKSTGKITEPALYEAALQMYKLARVNFEPSSIIIYGKSIGTGIATQLASIRDCRRLILETPYYGLASLVNNIFWMYPINNMIHFQLPTYEYISKVTAPISIFHGSNDELIALSNASKLKSKLKSLDEFIIIENGNHNNLNSFPIMQLKLDSLLKQ